MQNKDLRESVKQDDIMYIPLIAKVLIQTHVLENDLRIIYNINRLDILQ